MHQRKQYGKILCFTYAGLSALECVESFGAENRA